jgi:hypothetical protein
MILDLTKNGHLSLPHLKLLNTIADEIKSSYMKMIDQVGRGHEHNIDWWVSEIASRNTYTNRLFDDCCLLIFIKKILKQEPDIQEIIVDSFSLQKILLKYVRKNYPGLRVTCRAPWQNRIKFITYPALKYFYRILLLLSRYLVCRLTIRYSAGRLPPDAILVDTFVFDHSFNGGVFQDRYFHGCQNHLPKNDEQSIYYNPTFLVSFRKTVSVFLSMRRSEQRFLPQEAFLKPSDYIFAFLYPFRAIKLLPRQTNWEGLDITLLLRSIWYNHLTSCNSMEGLLKYRFAARLREFGVSFQLIIDWFENQSIDKGANAGFRKFYPEVPLIGYSSIGSKHFLCNAHPTSEEYKAEVLPRVLAVCGKGFLAQRKAFCPELEVTTAPAFRHAWVWKEATSRPDPNYTTVLVVLSLLVRESINSLRACINAVTLGLPPNVRFWVKPHPGAKPIEKLMLQEGITLPFNFTVINGDFRDWVEKADIIVGNESSTVLEALARGIPVIVIGNTSGITMHCVPDAVSIGLWQLCYTPDEVAEAFKYFINRNDKELQRHKTIAETIREQYFEPVTEKVTKSFCCLNDPHIS